MIIKVLGSGCKKCVALGVAVQHALAQLHLSAEVVKVTDYVDIAAYGVMSTPALVIDETVVSMGKVLSADEVIALLRAR